jgi:hypothetical protein
MHHAYIDKLINKLVDRISGHLVKGMPLRSSALIARISKTVFAAKIALSSQVDIDG